MDSSTSDESNIVSNYYLEKRILEKVAPLCDVYQVLEQVIEMEEENPMNLPQEYNIITNISEFVGNGSIAVGGDYPSTIRTFKATSAIEIAEQACWLISNCMGDGYRVRDVCLRNANILDSVIRGLDLREYCAYFTCLDLYRHYSSNTREHHDAISSSCFRKISSVPVRERTFANGFYSNFMKNELIPWLLSSANNNNDNTLRQDDFNQSNLRIVNSISAGFYRTLVWTISNCLRFKPCPDAEYMQQAAPVCCHFIQNYINNKINTDSLQERRNSTLSDASSSAGDILLFRIEDGLNGKKSDYDVVCDALWAVNYISDASGTISEPLMKQCQQNAALFDNLKTILMTTVFSSSRAQLGNTQVTTAPYNFDSTTAANLQLPCIRIFGNCCSGSDDMTRAVTDTNVVRDVYIPLYEDFSAIKRSVRKEIAWTVSNIVASGEYFINHVVFETRMLTLLIDRGFTYRLYETDSEVMKEILWCITNCCVDGYLTSSKMFELCTYFIHECKIFELFNKVLLAFEIDLRPIVIILETLENILVAGETHVAAVLHERHNTSRELPDSGLQNSENPFLLPMARSGLWTRLQALENHVSHVVFTKTKAILNYFDLDDQDLEKLRSVCPDEDDGSNNNQSNVHFNSVIGEEQSLTTEEKYRRMEQELADLTVGEAQIKRNR